MVEENIKDINELSPEILDRAALTGIDPQEKERSGTFFQLNNSVICSRSKQEGIEALDLETALKKYDGLKEYYWKAVDPNKDEYTKMVKDAPPKGYFFRSLPGVETIFPLQSCLFMEQKGIIQKVHNIIIAEEGSHLHIITGCTVSPKAQGSMHIGISEFFVKKNASITFTMIHNWAEEVEARPRSVAYVEEGGTFINNYICMRPVKMLQLYPTVHLIGKGARTVGSSVILGKKNSVIDAGFRAILKAEGTSAESIARVVAEDESKIYSRGHMVGEVPNVKAHLECRGLVLSPKAYIYAVPELEAKQVNLEMSHEAAVGKIAEKEILYLMSRGLSEEEATSAIIRGFLKVDLTGLPPKLQAEVKALTEKELKNAL
ncbi:MAG: SufD family Fe-S cluster assembly protein [Candidatus Saganbacteria bacterium]|nr:SufD family Fe-S cluster assembly protein [Candidatus Saganbacteria bacterium]